MASATPPRISLLINIDHVATLRNARGGARPDPVEATRVCLRAGANGVVCHLREDRRHIRDRDVFRLRHELRTKLDLEMAATPEIIAIAMRTLPDLVTLVPERRRELTTEGGLDVAAQSRRLAAIVRRFHDAGIPVSLFVDPVLSQVAASAATGAEMIELHTGGYADARSSASRAHQLERLRRAAHYGHSLGLRVNAGHGLDFRNTAAVARIAAVGELSIGYAIMAEAMFSGLGRSVRRMADLIHRARRSAR